MIPIDIALKKVAILITCLVEDGDKFYPINIFRRSINSIKKWYKKEGNEEKNW